MLFSNDEIFVFRENRGYDKGKYKKFQLKVNIKVFLRGHSVPCLKLGLNAFHEL